MPPRKRIVKPICFLLLTCLVLGVGLRGAYRGREIQRRLTCASNLKDIATSAKIYTHGWDGTKPVIDWLVANGQVDPRSLTCPSSSLFRSNYVVVPIVKSRSMDDRTVIAYEPKSNHGGEGGNVVFADGHASFVPVPEYDEIVSSVAEANP